MLRNGGVLMAITTDISVVVAADATPVAG
jgi:hypothetical protein